MTRLKLPEDARAVQLYERLNHRYFHFVDHLPLPLSKLARLKSTFLGGPIHGPFEGVPDLNPVLASTPWLFWEVFSELEDGAFLDIAEAGTMYVLASIVLDHIVDGQADPLEWTILLYQALYGHGITMYRRIFPSQFSFWEHYDRLASAHLAGLSKEVEFQIRPGIVQLEDLRIMAHGKVSPIVTTIAALAEASKQPHMLEPIESSLKHIAVASQMLDDVGDWKQDEEVGHFTYYLSQLAPPEAWQAKCKPSADDLVARIESEWSDVEHLRMVIKLLDQSLCAVKGVECPSWIEYVKGYRELTEEHMTMAMARHLIQKLRRAI